MPRWVRRVGARALWLALAPVCAGQQGAQGHGERLPTLTTARAVHQLSMAEAARGYPVRLHAVVSYFDPYLDSPQPILLVTDRTGTIFVKLPQLTDLKVRAGQAVEVRGQSVPGGFAPDVDRPRVRVVGEVGMPRLRPGKTGWIMGIW
jgi:hypothetical protein